MCQRPSLQTPKCGLTQFSAHRVISRSSLPTVRRQSLGPARHCPIPLTPTGAPARARPASRGGGRPGGHPQELALLPATRTAHVGPSADVTLKVTAVVRRQAHAGPGPAGALLTVPRTVPRAWKDRGTSRLQLWPPASVGAGRGWHGHVAAAGPAARRALRPAGDRGARGTAGPAPGLTRPAGPRRPLWTTRPPPRRASGC